MHCTLISLAVLGFASALAAPAANPVVVIDTSMGIIKLELFEDKAPLTVKNFLGYVDDKFYDNTIIHRVLGKESAGKDTLIQGGGYESGMKEKKVKEPVINESANAVKNLRGTVAAARTPQPNSATSQFFINLVDNTAFDRVNARDGFGYCVFGKVTEGMDVVDKIKAVKTGNKAGHVNVPLEDVVIKSIRRQADDGPPKPPASR